MKWYVLYKSKMRAAKSTFHLYLCLNDFLGRGVNIFVKELITSKFSFKKHFYNFTSFEIYKYLFFNKIPQVSKYCVRFEIPDLVVLKQN